VTTESVARVALAVALAATVACARAAEDGLRQATQLLERNHYESAAAILRAEGGRSEAAGVAALTLGRAHARAAELYRALHRSSLATGTRYLRQVATQSGADRSRLAGLYYGEYLVEAGKTAEGIAQLRRFLAALGADREMLENGGPLRRRHRSGDALHQALQDALAISRHGARTPASVSVRRSLRSAVNIVAFTVPSEHPMILAISW